MRWPEIMRGSCRLRFGRCRAFSRCLAQKDEAQRGGLLDCMPMVPRFLVLVCLLAVLPASVAQTRPAQYAVRQEAIRRRGNEALMRERARSKADLCSTARSGGNAAIGACLIAEGKTTEQDYANYVLAMGALLRFGASDHAQPPAGSSPKQIPFDAAEKVWRVYREQSCQSVATQWAGGDQAPVASANCRLTLTWNHMNELADFYSDLWH